MEDLLEEILGDIKDEYDSAEEFVVKTTGHHRIWYFQRPKLELDYLASWKIRHELLPDSDETETLSGFIIQNRDEIPKQKETFTVGKYQFDILEM